MKYISSREINIPVPEIKRQQTGNRFHKVEIMV